MGAKSTSSGKQIDNMQAIGFDGYNATLTGEQSATLGVNCGMTTGRNGVLVKAIGFDTYNQVLTGGVARTLTSVKSDCDHVPCVFVLNEQDKKGDSVTEDKTNALLKDPKRQPVICLNDQGGGFMSVSMDKTATLRAQMGGHPPIVYTLKIRGGEKVEAREH